MGVLGVSPRRRGGGRPRSGLETGDPAHGSTSRVSSKAFPSKINCEKMVNTL